MHIVQVVIIHGAHQGSLLLTWINFNPCIIVYQFPNFKSAKSLVLGMDE